MSSTEAFAIACVMRSTAKAGQRNNTAVVRYSAAALDLLRLPIIGQHNRSQSTCACVSLPLHDHDERRYPAVNKQHREGQRKSGGGLRRSEARFSRILQPKGECAGVREERRGRKERRGVLVHELPALCRRTTTKENNEGPRRASRQVAVRT